MELAGSWLKSIDTSGALLTAKTPFMGPLAAATIALFTVSASVSLVAVKVRSISDTFGVGTRIAVPSNLPASSGSTKPTARAAPVEVGIIDIAAARARCRSEWRVSKTGWSPSNLNVKPVNTDKDDFERISNLRTGAERLTNMYSDTLKKFGKKLVYVVARYYLL